MRQTRAESAFRRTRGQSRGHELVQCCDEDPHFLHNVITGDESWIFEYDPETKTTERRVAHCRFSKEKKKARMSKSKIKAMLIVFFDAKGIVHHEYVHPGQTVTGKFYVQVLQRPNARVNRVRPEIKNSWRLHHDNAPAHTAAVTAAILTKLGVSVILQPRLGPRRLFLFPRIKRALKGHHLGTLENVKATATRCLKGRSTLVVADEF